MSASWDLQRGLYQTIAADNAVTTLLGGVHIYDDVPRDAAFPYLTLGETVVRDWSTGSDEGDEHLVTLHVWSRANGRRQTHRIMAALKLALHDATVSVANHRLVNMRFEFSDARREPDGETYHGVVRFRAVTEALATGSGV